jgi:hypothetical protein
MPPRSQTFLRLTRALLACLLVLLAFEPPAPRVELTPSAAAVAAVESPVRASLVRRAQAPRIAPARPLVAARSDATPVEPLLAVRRLYVELCSLLC